jgi:hypothetical protein
MNDMITGANMTTGRSENLSGTSNDGESDLVLEGPYTMKAKMVGVCPLLFHAWSCDAVAVKAAAAKGSQAKKSDNVESYVYRDERKHICLPGEYFRQSIIHAAKFRQDPRSPRKSAMDLFKAGVISTTEFAPIMDSTNETTGPKTDWDFLDRRRVVIKMSAITRERPAFRKGWAVEVDLQVLLPEYIDQALLQEVLVAAGRLVGVGDFRPTFGRFRVTAFERTATLSDDEVDAAQ